MIKVVLKLLRCLQAPASAAEGTGAAAAGAQHAPEEVAENAAAGPRNAPEQDVEAAAAGLQDAPEEAAQAAAAGPQAAHEGGAVNYDPALEGVPSEVMFLVS